MASVRVPKQTAYEFWCCATKNCSWCIYDKVVADFTRESKSDPIIFHIAYQAPVQFKNCQIYVLKSGRYLTCQQNDTGLCGADVGSFGFTIPESIVDFINAIRPIAEPHIIIDAIKKLITPLTASQR